jgi:hypothetical protein
MEATISGPAFGSLGKYMVAHLGDDKKDRMQIQPHAFHFR